MRNEPIKLRGSIMLVKKKKEKKKKAHFGVVLESLILFLFLQVLLLLPN